MANHGFLELRGRTTRWGPASLAVIGLCLCLGVALRVWGLSAEGFGDDEVHKWLAANRYLLGDLGGDDVEHPMLMKSLIALCLLVGRPLGWAPETMTRLPNAIAGGISVVVVALLGRRLFGRTAGLLAAALTSVAVTLVGYQRVAKEDTLLGLFLMVLLWCTAEAVAAGGDAQDQRLPQPERLARHAEQERWELRGAAGLGAMLASKYFPWLPLCVPIFLVWMKASTPYRLPLRRWAQLVGVALVVWAALNWTPFLPSTWAYAKSYVSGGQTVHGSLFFMGRIYHNLVDWGVKGTPPWYYLVFTAVKLTPGTLLLALAGLALAVWRRRPSHKLILCWMAVWFVLHSLSGSKWGRIYLAVMPALLLLAAHAAAEALERLRTKTGERPAAAWRLLPVVGVLIAVLAVAGEAGAAISHAPHQRLYVSPLGGGDARVGWYFPHCDYFDAGFREAVAYVAANAEPGAELSTEIDWPARLYAGWDGRPDLLQTLVRRGRTCRSGRACYVVVQTGRLYFLNQDAVANLAKRQPWHVERIRGEEVVKVYRLPPGESPFPDENPLAQ
jgi:4-amino-4-deoxy-L-arabinose transferase-like glycosyltransferase